MAMKKLPELIVASQVLRESRPTIAAHRAEA
jgi:hypothetical protein